MSSQGGEVHAARRLGEEASLRKVGFSKMGAGLRAFKWSRLQAGIVGGELGWSVANECGGWLQRQGSARDWGVCSSKTCVTGARKVVARLVTDTAARSEERQLPW